jgi:hypothetical protein
VGDFEAVSLGMVESKYGIPLFRIFISNLDRKPVDGQCMVGSLTGAVAC